MPNFELILSKMGKKDLLIHDGYVYINDKKTELCTYYKCTDHKHCKGRGKLATFSELFEATQEHNHAAQAEQVEKR